MTGAKINREKSVGLRLGSLKGCALPDPFIWKDGPCKILGVWFGPDLQLEKNWSEVLEKVVAATELWLRRRLSLKGRAEVCYSHIYSLVVYRLSVLPIPPTILFKLERILFQFIWAKRFSLVQREICYLHPSEGGLGVPNVETRRHTLRLTFLDRMCSRDTAAGNVWKEDAKQSFPLLRSVHSADGDAHRLPRRECPFYRECQHALKVLSRLQTGLSDIRPLSSRALYLCLVRGALAMVWLASSVWRRRRVACCGLGPPGWGVSITTRLPSPGWSFGMPSGSARNFFQRNRLFRQSAAGAVIWRRLLVTPSFTARSCGRCASFLKATWFASSMESSSSWKPVLCAAMWYRSWTDRNIMCFSAYSAYCVSWFGRRERRNSTRMSFFLLRPWWHFLSTKSKSKSGLRERDSLHWSLAKGRWLLRTCVAW